MLGILSRKSHRIFFIWYSETENKMLCAFFYQGAAPPMSNYAQLFVYILGFHSWRHNVWYEKYQGRVGLKRCSTIILRQYSDIKSRIHGLLAPAPTYIRRKLAGNACTIKIASFFLVAGNRDQNNLTGRNNFEENRWS